MEAAAHGHSTLGIPKSVGQEFVNADKHDAAEAPKKVARCSGVAFKSGNSYLLIKRVDNGVWEHPGGHIDDGETTKQAAFREALEELGVLPKIAPTFFRVSRGQDVEYTTFLANSFQFTPTLSKEHTDWRWVTADSLPENTHPEVVKTISILDAIPGTELEAAKMVRDGTLPSGVKYENIWLFDIRFTGTGISYRPGLKEYVFRDPAIFATAEFAERCNAIPVILEHPEKTLLNAEEFANRAIGTVMLPYVKGDEVWGIGRIYDDEAAESMASGEISTSPGVRFPVGEIGTMHLDDDALTVEGTPKLVDHIAIVLAGVWDKGGPPSGIRPDNQEIGERADASAESRDDAALEAAQSRAINRKDDKMAEEDKGEGARQDAATALMDKLDAICSRMDALTTRVDAFDKKDAEDEKAHDKEGDAEREALKEHEKEEVKSDKKDAAEDKKEDKDAKDSGAESAALRAQISAMQAKVDALSRPVSHDEIERIAGIQSRADSVMQLRGQHAPQPMAGESARSYRLRVLAGLGKYSDRFKDISIDKLDGAVLDEIEKGIYNDAQAAAVNPANAPQGRLIAVRSTENGHTVTRYHGDPSATFAAFEIPGRKFSINNPRRGGNA